MDHRADLYVLPHPKGGWQVRRHAAAKAIRRVASYQEALEIAARMAANEQLSLLARYRPAVALQTSCEKFSYNLQKRNGA